MFGGYPYVPLAAVLMAASGDRHCRAVITASPAFLKQNGQCRVTMTRFPKLAISDLSGGSGAPTKARNGSGLERRNAG